ncbi:hypothetical protein LOK49_LG06G02324 [Camellia lanceoleosa]|uniref:Uncharacterized protein n=1 Tax=Camellia lanceoleosa TaxID=1840588 RepID=A0ACC0HB98_9ERIC|nr:hypothetical protein LOK49_LG06G02324 [Camellia lanceoleosa]
MRKGMLGLGTGRMENHPLQKWEECSSNYQYSETEKEAGQSDEDDEVDESEEEVADGDKVAFEVGDNNRAGKGSKSSGAVVSVVNETCNEVEESGTAGAGLGNEESLPGVIIQSTNMGSRKEIKSVPSVAFMKSISSQDFLRPPINLKVVLDQAQSNGLAMGLNQGRIEWHKEVVQSSKSLSVVQWTEGGVSSPVATDGQTIQKLKGPQHKKGSHKCQVEQRRNEGEANLNHMALRKRKVGQNKLGFKLVISSRFRIWLSASEGLIWSGFDFPGAFVFLPCCFQSGLELGSAAAGRLCLDAIKMQSAALFCFRCLLPQLITLVLLVYLTNFVIGAFGVSHQL